MPQPEYDMHFKILLMGRRGTGKSSLLQQFVTTTYTDHYSETLGVEQQIKFLNLGNNKIKLRVWDAGDSFRFWTLIKKYIPLAQSIFLCFDVTNQGSFADAQTLISSLKEFGDNTPIYLIGCKSDLTQSRVVSFEEAQFIAEKLGLTYIETSSVAKINTNTPFMEVTRRLYFCALLAQIRPSMEHHFNHYLKPYVLSNATQSLFKRHSIKENYLKEEYKTIFKSLFKATQPQEIEDFFIKTLDILKRADDLFKSENPLLSNLSQSLLSKALRKSLIELCNLPKHIIDLSALKELIDVKSSALTITAAP